MASEYELSIDVNAPVDVAWSVVGDVTSVPRWYPKYATCEVDGDIRTLRSTDGAELVERLLERDEAERRYAYTVLAGPPLRSHLASFQVIPNGEGSTILWRTAATFSTSRSTRRRALAPPSATGSSASRPSARPPRADRSPRVIHIGRSVNCWPASK